MRTGAAPIVVGIGLAAAALIGSAVAAYLIPEFYVMLKGWSFWLWGQLLKGINLLLATLGIPPIIVPGLNGPIVNFLRMANHWVPLQEAWTLAVSYFTVWAGVRVVKWALKAIPGVWG
jgi:hypothetical protein